MMEPNIKDYNPLSMLSGYGLGHNGGITTLEATFSRSRMATSSDGRHDINKQPII